MKIPSVFISRNAEEYKELKKLNIVLTDLSLIATKGVPFAIPERSFEWIFFSSANAVKYFFESNPNLSHLWKLAAIGQGTANWLQKFGKVDFIGSSDIHATGGAFVSMAGTGCVLFPIGDKSLRSIQSFLPEHQIAEVVCYETILAPRSIAPQDMYIFSSPSNVNSFFSIDQRIPPEAEFFSFGLSTHQTLQRYGIRSNILSGTGPQEIFDAIIRTFPGSLPDSYL